MLSKIPNQLSLPYEKRNYEFLHRVLVPYIKDVCNRKKSPLSDELAVDVCNGLTYCFKSRNTLVVKHSESDDIFYLILEGRVSIWTPQSNNLMKSPLVHFKEQIKKVFKDMHFKDKRMDKESAVDE